MPEALADRSSHSRSKRQEILKLATSRKRKLRELYAVCDSYSDQQPIPFVAVENLDDYPTTPDEEQLFAAYDISQNAKSIEDVIPATRRQLRSDTKNPSSRGTSSVDARAPDSSRASSRGLREDGARKLRGGTPAKDNVATPSNGLLSTPDGLRHGRSAARLDGSSTRLGRGPSRASSRGSQTELASASIDMLDTIVDETIEQAEVGPIYGTDQVSKLPPGSSEAERIESRVESRHGSPGVDPRKAIPISAEDAANLSEPILNGAQDEHHKAAIAHLPPKEVQEKRLRDADERRAEKTRNDERKDEGGHLSIRPPPLHSSRTVPDPMSSPGSTIDAQSATTPALHDTSADTSPDNEGPRYGLDRSDEKDEIPETPPESALGREEMPERVERNHLLKTQMDISRDTVGSSPATADAQLRLEEEQAAAAASTESSQEVAKIGSIQSQNGSPGESQRNRAGGQTLTRKAEELVQDTLDDEDDEVIGIPTLEDQKAHRAEGLIPRSDMNENSSSVPGEAVESMDLDTAADEEPNLQISVNQKTSQEESIALEEDQPSKKDVPPLTTSTPRRTPSTQGPTPPTQERMTTRVSSGAMRHKSVSEILGEIPRPNTSTSDRTFVVKTSSDPESTSNSTSQSRSSTPQSPGHRPRSLLERLERTKEKERSKLSTVVFAKQPSPRVTSTSLVPSNQRTVAQDQPADYFMPLIVAQATNQTRQIQPLESLLQSAHKTVTTSNLYVPVREHQSIKVLRRVFRLQQEDKWSLRQPKRSLEPNRPTTHWDELLKEAKWMRTDFRQEKKWKTAVARNLAYACAEWVEADGLDRQGLQVNATIPPKWSGQIADTEMQDANVTVVNNAIPATPELVASAESDSLNEDFDDEPQTSLLHNVAPTTIFALSNDDVVFGLRRSTASDRLLEQLPMYGVPLKVPRADLPTSDIDPDASWRRPALPLSKYMDAKIVLKEDGPPRKRSRYYYEEEDDDEEHIVFGEDGHSKRSHLPPVLTDVALFNPANKHIRDRIHAGHQFRPPSEYPMPLQSFFESRLSSQWTVQEDDELRSFVRDYSYNWQLISCLVSSPSTLVSGAERRTPWECFERWIHLEGLPADMQKTHYFRAYNNRLEAAQRNLMSQAQLAPQVNAAGALVPTRRRTTTSVRVERRRNQKHLTLVDAMRKLAKKRETSIQKQQHAASLAAMRKQNEQPQPQNARHTPQDFSRLKHERELQLQERLNRLQMQQEAQRRAMAQQRNAQQNPQQYGAPNNGSSQQPRNPTAPNAVQAANLPVNGNRPNQLAVPGQNLPHPPMQPMPNGMGGQLPMPHPGSVPQMPLKGVPQAQMNGMPGMSNMQGIPGQLPVPNAAPDLRLVMQARQISEQQRQAVQRQQQSQQHQGQNPPIQNSPPNMRANMNGNVNAMNQQAYMQNNQAMMAAFNAGNMNGISSPPANGFNVQNQGSAASPRMHPNQMQQMQNGSVSPQIAKLEQQFRAQNPMASQEQINTMVREALNKNLAHQRQSAMHAAAGNGTPLQGMPGGMQNSPQQYAQMLRAQQEKQAASVAQQSRSASAGSASGNNVPGK